MLTFTTNQKRDFAPEFVDYLFEYQEVSDETRPKYTRIAQTETWVESALFGCASFHIDLKNEVELNVHTAFRQLFDAIVAEVPSSASKTAALRSCLLGKMCATKSLYETTPTKRIVLLSSAHQHLQAAVLQANFAISHEGQF